MAEHWACIRDPPRPQFPLAAPVTRKSPPSHFSRVAFTPPLQHRQATGIPTPPFSFPIPATSLPSRPCGLAHFWPRFPFFAVAPYPVVPPAVSPAQSTSPTPFSDRSYLGSVSFCCCPCLLGHARRHHPPPPFSFTFHFLTLRAAT